MVPKDAVSRIKISNVIPKNHARNSEDVNECNTKKLTPDLPNINPLKIEEIIKKLIIKNFHEFSIEILCCSIYTLIQSWIEAIYYVFFGTSYRDCFQVEIFLKIREQESLEF